MSATSTCSDAGAASSGAPRVRGLRRGQPRVEVLSRLVLGHGIHQADDVHLGCQGGDDPPGHGGVPRDDDDPQPSFRGLHALTEQAGRGGGHAVCVVHEQHDSRHHRELARVRSVVVVREQLASEDVALGVEGGTDRDLRSLSTGGDQQVFVAGEHELDRATRRGAGQQRGVGLGAEVELAAKTAPDRLALHPHIARPDGEVTLLPFTREVFPIVDLSAGRLTVVPPEEVDPQEDEGEETQ